MNNSLKELHEITIDISLVSRLEAKSLTRSRYPFLGLFMHVWKCAGEIEVYGTTYVAGRGGERWR